MQVRPVPPKPHFACTLQARVRVVPTRLGITETEKETLEKGGSVNKESMKKNSGKSAVKVQISGFQLVAKPSV